jgi:ABC-type amino acid transport substrate-binding protein
LLAALLAPCLAVQARTVTVGLYQNPPKLMADDQGQAGGILGEVLQAIAREEGWTLQAVRCEWEACLAALNQGKLDLMPDVARTDARLAQFDFHQVPALHSWSQLYRRKDVVAESMLDLQGRRVAVLEGSSQQEYLRPLLSGFGLDTRLVAARSFDEAFALVREGQADVAASNHHFGDFAARRYQLEDTPLIFMPTRLFYAAGKGRNPELLDAIDRHLAAWQAEPGSPYFGVLKRWAPQRNAGQVPTRFWWGLGAIGAMLLLALAFVALLRREVASVVFDS